LSLWLLSTDAMAIAGSPHCWSRLAGGSVVIACSGSGAVRGDDVKREILKVYPN
jgi:hypothetical protein